MSEQGTWKVYEKQWIIVFASDTSQYLTGQRQCQDAWEGAWDGKVAREDMNIVPLSEDDDELSRLPWYLKVRLWTLTAEYKSRPGQWRLAEESPEVEIVRTGSPEEAMYEKICNALRAVNSDWAHTKLAEERIVEALLA